MKKLLIVANWKMNPGTLGEAKHNFEIIKKGVRGVKKVEVVVCAPFVFLSALKPSNFLKVGAQDCFFGDKGPFTGEISPWQLKNLGVEYVILGHSERRRHLSESTELVNQKIKTALEAGLKVVFCVGSEAKKSGKETKFQLEKGLKEIKKSDLDNIVFVYEPVWAISTSKNKIIATPQEALNGGLYMRKTLEKIFDKKTAAKAKIIYGGSVDSKNIRGFVIEGRMVGGLPGAASLDPREFVRIVKSVDFANKAR